MPLTSMTGFARADGEREDARWYWEVRSVNGKSLDVRIRTAPGYEGLEPEIRSTVARFVRRGNCQVSLQVTREKQAMDVSVNEAALQSLLDTLDRLGPRVKASPPSLDGLLSIKGVVELKEPEETEEQTSQRTVAILETLEVALEGLRDAREAEGARLADLLSGQIDAIEALVKDAVDCPARTPEAIRDRIREQVARLTEQAGGLDEDRLYQEALLMAAKVDVQEEVDRLVAHVAAARELLASNDTVGRRFDFLTQEFNREANTLCSKANDPALTAIGLEMKAVIDQMREQVQNIE